MSRRGRPNTNIPDHAIDALFGRGYNATRWKIELEAQGYTWNPGLKNRIIGRQFKFFKDEIGCLLSAPGFRRSDGTMSNSCKSILQVLKGETSHQERDQRLQNKRLFGPESAPRTLEDKVKKWREEDASYGFPPPPNNTAQFGVSAEDSYNAGENDQDPHRSDHGHPTGSMAIPSRQNDTDHSMPWTSALMSNSTLHTSTPESSHQDHADLSTPSAPTPFYPAVDYSNTHQQLSTQENNLIWDHDMVMMNSASGYALADNGSIPHDPDAAQRELVQPHFQIPYAACPTNYTPSTPNHPNQSDIKRVERDLLAALSPEILPHYSNTALDSAMTSDTHIQLPLTNGRWLVGVATRLLEKIAGQQEHDHSMPLKRPDSEIFDHHIPDTGSNELPSQDTEMPNVDDFQPPNEDELRGECTIQLAELLRRTVSASQLSCIAKQAAKSHRARQNRPHIRVFRETRLRRNILDLNSEVRRLKKDLRNATVALEQKVHEKDVEILKLTDQIRDLELLEIHSSEKIRQEAGLARQKDAAKKANSDPPLNHSAEDDIENSSKRTRVVRSNNPLPFKLNTSKPPPPLSFYPKIDPQTPSSDHREPFRLGKEMEASSIPSSQGRAKTPEPITKETLKEDKSPKRSLKAKLSDKFLGKKYEAAPPVPQMDYQPSKPLLPPPNNSDIDGDDATKRFTVATMDSGYQSLDIPSARHSVGSIE